jgi:two-component system sensor histidine kinase MtrB
VMAGIAVILALSLMADGITHTTRLLGEAVESVRASEELQLALLTVDREGRLRDVSGDVTHRSYAKEAVSEVRDQLRVIRDFAASDAERALVDKAETEMDTYLDAMARGTRPDLAPILALLDEVSDMNVTQAREGRAWAQELDSYSQWAAIALSVLLGGSLLLAGFLMSRGVYRPLMSMRDAVGKYRTGDRTLSVPLKGALELRDVAAELNTMASAIAAEENARLQFVAGVAHDLRNPLQALKLSARAVETMPSLPESRLREFFRRASGSVGRMERMIHDLMDRSQIQSGELSVSRSPVDLCELVRDVVELFGPTSDRHVLTVHVPEQACVATVDGARIEQVLINLVSNALKYSPHGGEVAVTASREDHDWVLSVRDEGLGISPEDQEGIFEPFRRSKSIREEIPGVGLGLAVSRKIVEAHGGRIEVHSQVGKGSEFRVLLPVNAAETYASPTV